MRNAFSSDLPRHDISVKERSDFKQKMLVEFKWLESQYHHRDNEHTTCQHGTCKICFFFKNVFVNNLLLA
jgi:hypothetical protein